MMWRVGSSAAAPDGQGALARLRQPQIGGRTWRASSCRRFDAHLRAACSCCPTGPSAQALFDEARSCIARLHAVQVPRAPHPHRHGAPAGSIGYRRPVFWHDWWHYVDIDAGARGSKPHEATTATRRRTAARWRRLAPPRRPTAGATGRRRAARRKVLRYAFRVAETGFDPAQDQRPVFAHRHARTSSRRRYGYDHLARPVKIMPLTAGGDAARSSADFRTWTVRIRPGIYFADDPAFKGKQRELVADDYVYAFKRFADPANKSPACGRARGRRHSSASTALRERGAEATRSRSTTTASRGPARARPLHAAVQARRAAAALHRRRWPTRACSARWRARWSSPTATQIDGAPGRHRAVPAQAVAAQLAASCSSATRLTASVLYDAEPARRRRRRPGAAARASRAGALPMIDEVEISIIEESQPRWLSFLNGEADFAERVPAGVRRPARCPAASSRRTSPSAASAACASSNADCTLTVLQHGGPGGRRLHAGEGRAAPRDQPGVRRRRARSAPSAAARRSRRSRRARRTPTATTRTSRARCSDYDPARAKALLDMYGYVDRDGDGWRELPDGKPLVLEMRDRSPTQLSAPVRRAVEEEPGRGRHPHRASRSAQWPENLKAARAGKLHDLVARLVGVAARRRRAPAAPVRPVDRAAQNLARFKHAGVRRALRAHARHCPTAPSARRCSARPSELVAAYMPYKSPRAPHLTDMSHPWVIGYRRPLFWQRVLAATSTSTTAMRGQAA